MDGFSSRLRSSEKSYWVEESLLAQVDLLKTEPKRDGDRRTLFHFLFPLPVFEVPVCVSERYA